MYRTGKSSPFLLSAYLNSSLLVPALASVVTTDSRVTPGSGSASSIRTTSSRVDFPLGLMILLFMRPLCQLTTTDSTLLPGYSNKNNRPPSHPSLAPQNIASKSAGLLSIKAPDSNGCLAPLKSLISILTVVESHSFHIPYHCSITFEPPKTGLAPKGLAPKVKDSLLILLFLLVDLNSSHC